MIRKSLHTVKSHHAKQPVTVHNKSAFITVRTCNYCKMDDIHANVTQPLLLSIGLLEESTPELILIGGMDEDETSIVGGETIVDDNVHPLAKVPEPEAEDSAVAVAPSLVIGHHLHQHHVQRRKTRQDSPHTSTNYSYACTFTRDSLKFL